VSRARCRPSNRIPSATAIATTIALLLHVSLPALASTETTLEGTIETPCDPARVADVAFLHIRPVAGGAPDTVPVDSSTGAFVVTGLTAGEYELVALGSDGRPVSTKTASVQIQEGANRVALSMEPPGCGQPDADGDGVPDAADACPDSPPGTAVGTDGCAAQGGTKTGGREGGLADWHITLIYFGVIGAIILALDDDEGPASPSGVQASD
jgi:hypothetical protein